MISGYSGYLQSHSFETSSKCKLTIVQSHESCVTTDWPSLKIADVHSLFHLFPILKHIRHILWQSIKSRPLPDFRSPTISCTQQRRSDGPSLASQMPLFASSDQAWLDVACSVDHAIWRGQSPEYLTPEKDYDLLHTATRNNLGVEFLVASLASLNTYEVWISEIRRMQLRRICDMCTTSSARS